MAALWHSLLIKGPFSCLLRRAKARPIVGIISWVCFCNVGCPENISRFIPFKRTLYNLEVSFYRMRQSRLSARRTTSALSPDHVPQFSYKRDTMGYGQRMDNSNWGSTPTFEAAQPNRAKWIVARFSLVHYTLIPRDPVGDPERNLTISQTVADKNPRT